MKKVIVLIMGMLVVIFSANAGYSLKIANFNLLDPIIEVGETFDVEVSVFDDGALGDLTGFGFDVDPFGKLSNISFDGYMIGPGFDDLGFGSYVSGAFDPFNPPPSNAGQNVLLATLSFEALSAGTDVLEIKGLFDGSFYGLYYLLGDEDIVGSTNISPVPEPATIFLIGTGLAGLAGLRRKTRKGKLQK